VNWHRIIGQAVDRGAAPASSARSLSAAGAVDIDLGIDLGIDRLPMFNG